MKILIAALLLITGVSVPAQASQVTHLVEQLRTLERIEGSAYGFPPRAGRFFLLAPYFVEYASSDDVRTMIEDKNPIVRVMAAQCIVKRDDLAKMDLEPMSGDPTKIIVFRWGCGGDEMTVGEIVRALRENPDYFSTAPEGTGSEQEIPQAREQTVIEIVPKPER